MTHGSNTGSTLCEEGTVVISSVPYIVGSGREVEMLDMYTVVDLDKILGLRVPDMRCAFKGGSRAMVDPPPLDTDLDICIHVSNLTETVDYLVEAGWDLPYTDDTYAGEYGDFRTLRKGEINLLLFENPYEFGAVWAATCLGKHLNMQCKKQRYKMFEVARSPWRGTAHD